MRILAMFAMGILVACNGSSTATGDERSAAQRLQAFALDPLEEPIGDWVSDQNALAVLASRFGEPLAVDVVDVPDRTSDAMLEEQVIDYGGLRFLVGASKSGARSWIMETEISGNAHAMKFGLEIGASRADVERMFEAAPSEVPSNPLILTTTTNPDLPDLATWDGATIDVMMTFEADRLVKVVVVPSVL